MVTPSTFNLVSVSIAVVKVVANAVDVKEPTAAFRHFERRVLQVVRRIYTQWRNGKREARGWDAALII